MLATVVDKNVFVGEITGGVPVDAPFVVDSAEIREKKDGGKYIHLTISDRSGRGACKVWGTGGQAARTLKR